MPRQFLYGLGHNLDSRFCANGGTAIESGIENYQKIIGFAIRKNVSKEGNSDKCINEKISLRYGI